MKENKEQAKEDQLTAPYLYFNLSSEEKESAIYLLLESILKARESVWGLTVSHGFDEDVNIYLAHLLFAMSLPEYHEMADPFISSNPQEVFEWIRQTEDPMLRYFIFKVNADHLLIQSTIFNPHAEPSKRFSLKKKIKNEKDETRLAAILYYNHASRCHKALYDKTTGVGEVLGKMAGQFDLYQQVMVDVREDYFKFMMSLKEQGFQNFLNKLGDFEKAFQREKKMDQFLEAYQRWLSQKDEGSKTRVLLLSWELSQLDPQFSFDLTKLDLP